jgi:putative ABC transport system permease protein
MFQDLRYAVRSLSRNPRFAVGAIATLALGIGVNSTIFTLANAALFRPMPGITAPSELVWISGLWRDRGRSGGMSYLEFLDYRDQSVDLFSNVLAFGPASFSLGSGGEPERIRGHFVSSSYFTGLGVVPVAGRLLQPSDDQAGSSPAAVISFRLWQQRFGQRIPQRSVLINGRPVSIVGVAPQGLVGPELAQSADVWIPIAAIPAISTTQAGWVRERGTLWLRVMGRLRPGVSIQQAQATLSGIAASLERTYPDTNTNRGALVSSASSGIRPSERSELLPIAGLLLTITGLVLLVACANVANLLLARGAGRRTEITIRTAIGASRWRLVRQLFTESLVLGIGGAAGGLLISFWASDFLIARLPELDFGGLRSAVDARVLLFTAVLGIASTCVFGLVPALTATRRIIAPRLRETTSARGRSRTQGIFVVAQLSLSLVLLLAAGLSLRALQKAGAIELGFNPHGLVTASYDLTLHNYALERREAFRRDLSARIEALPSVTSATVADLPPLSGTMVSTVVTTTDDRGRSIESRAFMSSVGARFFATLGIPLLRGRGIEASDARGAPVVGVVNETLARQLWPDSDPLGRELQLEGFTVDVIGVARDAKYDETTEDPRPFLYLALAQHAQLDRETIIVRSAAGTTLTGAVVKEQIRALDPALPVFDVRPFDAVLRDRADKQRGMSALFAAFGMLALLLASLGLYGVMSYAVTSRTREIGVRLALGATPRQLMRLMAGDGFRLAMTGVFVGGLLALPLARALGALIFGVQMADLATFIGTCILLIAVAMLAAFLPARRAAHLDPIAALRTE